MDRRNTFEKNFCFQLLRHLTIFSCLWIFIVLFLSHPAHAGGEVPVAFDDSYSINEGGLLNPAAPALLANDNDAEGDSLTAAVDTLPSFASAFTLEADGSFSYTHDGSENFADSFTYTASDGTGTSVPATVTINIDPVNDAPELSAIGNQSVDELIELSFTATASDVDVPAETLSYSLDAASLAAGMTIDANSGTFSWTPSEAQDGVHSVTVTVTDDGSGTLSDSEAFTITVAEVNVAPVITSTAPTAATEDELYSYALTVVDPDDANNGTDLSFMLSNEPLGMTISSTGEIEWTPLEGVTSSGEVTVTVSDEGEDGALPAVETFTVSVTPVNDAPVIGGTPPISVDEDMAYSFTPTASDDDAGATLTFSITNAPDWASFNTSTGELSGTPENADVGTTPEIVIAVTDGIIATPIQLASFDLEVVNVNDAPVISGTPPTSVDEDTAYSFTPTASDDDAGATLTFSIANAPDWADFNATTGELSGTPANADVGTTPGIVIAVTDGIVATPVELASFDLEVVNANDAPVIGGTPPISVDEDTLYSFTPTASDDDAGATLTFSITNAPSWAAFDVSTGELSGTPANADVGTTPGIVIAVTDGIVATPVELASFDLTVVNVNDAPVIGGTPLTSVDEDTLYSFTPTASDDDAGSTLTYSITNAPDWASFDESTGELSGTPANADVGTTSGIVIAVTDGIVATPVELASFDLTVVNVNDAPVISGTPPTSVDEDTAYSFTPTASDDDAGSTLTYSITNAPDWTNFNSSTGELSGTPANADVGTTSGIVIAVTDGIVATPAELASFDLTVVNVNDAPVIGGTPPTSVDEDTLYSFTPTASDDDAGSTLTYSITNAPDWTNFNSSTGELSGTPANADVGTTSGIVIAVTDGIVATPVELASFDLEVVNVNDAPVIGGTPPTSVDEDTLYSFTPTASDDDAGATLTFSITNAPDWANFNTTTGELSGTPENADVGTTPGIVIAVTDGIVATPVELASFDLEVVNVNDAPVISGTPLISVDEDTAYSFTPTASDDDAGATLTYSITNAPDWANFNTTTGELSGTPQNADVGMTAGIVIAVTDGIVATPVELASFDLTVFNVNDAPVISGTPLISVDEDTAYSFTPTASDDDAGATLTFSITNAPSWASFDESTGELSGTPANADVGTTSGIVIAVTDGIVATPVKLASFDLEVVNVNDAPVIMGQSPLSTVEETELTIELGDLSVTDPDNAYPTGFTLTVGDGGNYSRTGNAITPNVDFNGILTVPVSVDDGQVANGTSTVFNLSVTVTAVNDAPVISSTAPAAATEDVLYSYQVAVADPDDENNGTDLSFSLTDAPAGMAISSTGLIEWTPLEGTTSSGSVTVTVADGGEDGSTAATELFTVAVTAVNDSPIITSTASTAATEDVLYSYQVAVSDPDDANNGTDLSFSLTNEPSGMTISSTGQIEWTPLEGVTSSGNVMVTVADGGEDEAATATEVFTVAVTAVNDAPIISSTAPAAATEDVFYSYQVVVTDPDDANNGTDLSFSLSDEPAGMTISSTGLIEWTPVEGVTSSGNVTVTVADGGEDGSIAATELFTITVTAVNDAPEITSTAPTAATEDVPYSYQVAVSDPDDANNGTDLSFSLTNEPSGMTISRTGQIEWTPPEGVTSSGNVTVTVADGGEDGATAVTELFTVAVTAVNDPPAITSTAPTAATEDVLYS